MDIGRAWMARARGLGASAEHGVRPIPPNKRFRGRAAPMASMMLLSLNLILALTWSGIPGKSNGGRGPQPPIRPGIPLFIGHPNLEAAAARASLEQNIIRLENGYVALEIKVSGRLPASATVTNRVVGKRYSFRLLDPLLGDAEHSLSGDAFVMGAARIENEADRARIHLPLQSASLVLDVTWEISRGDHFLRQQMVVRNRSSAPVTLGEIWPERFGFDREQLPSASVKSSSLTDIVAYLADPAGDGLFVTLDFPYCLLKLNKQDRLDVGYPPDYHLAPGEELTAHAVVLGVFTAPSKENPDSGRGFAFLRWVTRADPPRIQVPQFHLYHLNNDMYDPRANLYYTYRGPEMGAYLRNLGATNTMLELAGELGFNSYQAMEEPFAFLEGQNPDPLEWDRVRRLAEDSGIRLGGGPISNQGILTPMTNPYLKPFSYGTGGADPQSPFYPWIFRDASGKASSKVGFCLGSDSFAKYFEDELVRLAHLYGFRLYNYDELPIVECFDAAHGHPRGGPGSLYRQVLNLTKVLENVRRRVPSLLWDTNLGFIPLQPKIVRYVDGIYPNDPTGTTQLITLNRNLNYDEARRAQYTQALAENGLPPVYFRQCQYFLSDNSIVRNLKTFEYEILLDFAMGPNLAVGHLWSELQELPYGQSVEARSFLKRWMVWAKDNYKLLASTRYLSTGRSGGHGYAHIEGDHGYIFLVNPNYWSTSFSLALDQHIGLWTGEEYLVRELHPVPRFVMADRLPWPRWGDVLSLEVAPLTVRVLEIAPAAEVHGATLLGAQGRVVPVQGDRYRVTMTGPQGHESRFAVLLPRGERAVSLSYLSPPEIEVNTEKQLHQLPASLLQGDVKGSHAWGSVRFPRTAARPELRTWAIQPWSLEAGLQRGLDKGFAGRPVAFAGFNTEASLGGFDGAYLENIFQEDRIVTLEMRAEKTDGKSASVETISLPPPEMPAQDVGSLPEGQAFWYSTKMNLPFVQVLGQTPAPDMHLYLVLLLNRYQEVAPPRVWINGKEAPVRFFSHVRAVAGTYYVDGSDAGLHSDDNTVVLFLRRRNKEGE